MKKIKFLFLFPLFLLFFSIDVYADDYNVSNIITSPLNGQAGYYKGADPSDGTDSYRVNTLYQGRLQSFAYNIPVPSAIGECYPTNIVYRITMNMSGNYWRNNFGTAYVSYSSSGPYYNDGKVVFVSQKQIYFNFKIPATETSCIQHVYVSLQSSDIALRLTGDTQWNLSSVVLKYNPSGGSSGGGTSPSPSPSDTQSIINNQNENTQSIINNQNENTQSIIENNNQNTQNIIDGVNAGANAINDKINEQINSQKVCKFIDKSNIILDNSLLNTLTNGGVSTNPVYGITDYISINSNSIIKVIKSFNISASTSALCFYDINKSLISCVGNNTLTTANSTISIPNNVSYVRFSIQKTSNQPTFQVCTDGNQSINDSLNNINDSLTDETAPEIDLDLDLDTNSPVSDLLTMPITILNKVFDITDDTCQAYVLPFDFSGGNNTLTFPCIDLRDYLGNSVYNILDTILCFYFCYEIGLMCISIYEDITSLRDGFDALYTPKHAKPLGKHTREVE